MRSMPAGRRRWFQLSMEFMPTGTWSSFCSRLLPRPRMIDLITTPTLGIFKWRKARSSKPSHSSIRGSSILQLLVDGNLASQFVGEVFEEDHLVLRLLSFRCVDGHQRGDAFVFGRPSGIAVETGIVLIAFWSRVVMTLRRSAKVCVADIHLVLPPECTLTTRTSEQ